MIEIQVDYQGQMRTRAVHGPSGVELRTDAPRDNNGLGELFSPTDLLATALLTCMLTVMGIRADKKGYALTGMRGRVEKHMVADPLRRIGKLVVEIWMPAGITVGERAKLEKTAHECPVRVSVSEKIDVPVTFHWPE